LKYSIVIDLKFCKNTIKTVRVSFLLEVENPNINNDSLDLVWERINKNPGSGKPKPGPKTRGYQFTFYQGQSF
jgi:hypothetical protein